MVVDWSERRPAVASPLSAAGHRLLGAGLVVVGTCVLVGGCSSSTAAQSPVARRQPSSAAAAPSTPPPATASVASVVPAAASSPLVGAPSVGCDPARAPLLVHVSGAEVSGGVLAVDGVVTHQVCGGADDVHFEDTTQPVHVVLAAGGHVDVVTTGGPGGVSSTAIPPATLPSRLHQLDTGVFAVTGPPRAAQRLDEQYHP